MESISFLPPQSSQKSEKDRKLVQSRIRAHTAQHRLQQDAKKKRQAAADYWRRLEDDEVEQDARNRSPRTPTSPQSILRKGNSDPFSAYAIQITPRLNQILSFYIANFLPTYYDIALVPSPSSKTILSYRHVEAKDDYNMAVGLLQHHSAAHGFFLAYGEIMAELSGNRDLRVEMMKLKGLAMTALQAQIRKYGDDDSRTLDAVLLLFQAAVFSGDHAEATIHGNVLRRLLYQKVLREGPQSIDVGHLFQALWLNLSLSATFMTPTLLDVDDWAPSIFAATLEQCQLQLIHTGPAASCRDIDHAVSGPLHTIFIDCRRLLLLYWTCPARMTSENDTASLFTYLYSEFFIHSSRLVNYLVSIRNGGLATDLDPTSPSIHEDVFRWHTHHTLATALLALMSASTATILNAGRALTMATNILLVRLQNALAPVLATCLSPSMSKREVNPDSADPRDNLCRAVWWALFVGTTIDHIPKSKQVHGTLVSTWFTDNFIALARHKQLHSPDQAKALLRRFVYTDDMLSNEVFWKSAFRDHQSGLCEAMAWGVPYPSPISECDV